MNLNLAEISQWLEIFKKTITTIPANKKVILAPSLPYLGLMAELAKTKGLYLAAQNVSIMEKGAHTGETGIFQVKDFCEYSIVGHSELKEPFDVSIKKRDLCIADDIIPIMCFVQLDDAKKAYAPSSLVTWEDPTNISVNGQYRAKSDVEIQRGIDTIRQKIPKEAPLIYGGSVNRQNIETLAKINGLNGVLVGNASNDAAHFAELVIKF